MRSTEAEGATSPSATGLPAHQRSIVALLIDRPYYAARAELDVVNGDWVVDHYLETGWRNGLDPSPTFQTARYVNATPGLPVDTNPFLYYLFDVVGEDALHAALDGLSETDVDALRTHFDAPWYLDAYPDVALSGNDPLVHYLTLGWRELRDPSPSFSTSAYRERYADVRNADANPFLHWVSYGIAEGRSNGKASLSPLDSWDSLSVVQQTILTRMFDLDYYRSRHVDSGMVDAASLARHVGTPRPASHDPGYVTPSFHAAKYIATRPEVRDTGAVPFLHYLFRGVEEDALRDLFVAQPRAIVQAVGAHFDTAWYLYSYPDVEASGQDALIHYMTVGWREGRDPSQDFSTRVYLLRYPDIVEAGANPFLHWIGFGKAEGRSGVSSANNFRNRPYAPAITAVLVNDEAIPLTPAGIAGVMNQTYAPLSVLVVGTPLSDDCRAALDSGARDGRDVTVLPPPDDGATSPAGYLERAVGQATGELLWCVRGRAIHDDTFLARLASSFADGSVQLGFGRCLEPDDADYAIDAEELARRMEGWSRHPTMPAAIWFADQVRSDRLGAERHGFLWRRRTLDASIWQAAAEYRHLGLWHLQLHMASGGQIAAVRDAVLRLPPGPPAPATRPDMDADKEFHVETGRFVAEMQSFWGGPDTDDAARTRRHVLIVTHGIFAGGAENLPIQLANALVERGLIVSLLIFRTDLNPEMRATLDPGCSIYEADWVMEYGCEQFLRDIGCSLIHSHGVIGEMFFYRLCDGPLPVPYVATLHGSYEAATSKELPERFIAKIVRNVDLFVYTADKNLAPLLRNDVRPEQVTKMINAMPVDAAPFPRSRAELGIAEDAIVFTLVARGIPEKGWSTAINAFDAVRRRHPTRAMHLCLVGEGGEPDRLKKIHAGDAAISFLGFQLRIHGLYRMTDVAIVPTRFAGESFPLCIIQALQVSVPVIATDVGEIASMLKVGDVAGGIVVPGSPDDASFDAGFTAAMDSLIDDERRRRITADAAILGNGYDMDVFTDQYVTLYEDVMRRFAAAGPAILVEPGDAREGVPS